MFQNKSGLLNITHGDVFANTSVLSYEAFDFNNLDQIKPHLTSFITKNNCKGAYCIITISEYKLFRFSIPIEVDDDELWFMENTAKFLPENQSSEDFNYSYYCYNKDESYKYYHIGVARKKHIQELEHLISGTELILYKISPTISIIKFPVSLDSVTNILIDINNGKISYLFCNGLDINQSGSLYFEENSSSQINDKIKEIYQTYLISLNKNAQSDISIYCSCKSENYIDVKNLLLEIFPQEKINYGLENFSSEYITLLLALNHLFHNETRINLGNQDQKELTTDIVEKQFSMKLILFCGSIILGLLLIAFFSENYFSSRIAQESQNIQYIQKLKASINDFNQKNSRLRANLNLLNDLKGKRDKYSVALLRISDLMPDNCYLKGLEIKKIDENTAKVSLNGFSNSQIIVTELLRNLEKDTHFRNSALLNSSAISKGNGIHTKFSSKIDPVIFNITTEYHVN